MSTAQEILWRRLVAESAAIIASILLAFTIDAWWADRSIGIQTNELLRDLEAEWTSELDRIDSVLTQFRRYRTTISQLYDPSQQSSAVDSEEKALQLYRAHRWSTFKPSTAALDIVLENGLNNIDDDAVRRAISAWHSVLEEPVPEQEALYRLTFDTMREVRQNIAHRLGLPVTDALDPAPLSWYGDDAGRLALAIFSDDDFLRIQRHVMDIAYDYERQVQSVRETLADNVALLREHLGG